MEVEDSEDDLGTAEHWATGALGAPRLTGLAADEAVWPSILIHDLSGTVLPDRHRRRA